MILYNNYDVDDEYESPTNIDQKLHTFIYLLLLHSQGIRPPNLLHLRYAMKLTTQFKFHYETHFFGDEFKQ